MVRRSFMRSVSPRIEINERIAKERKQEERDRIKKVKDDRRKVADRLKKQGYTCKLEKKNINIDNIKKEVIEIIKSLKFTGQYSKEWFLIKKFRYLGNGGLEVIGDKEPVNVTHHKRDKNGN